MEMPRRTMPRTDVPTTAPLLRHLAAVLAASGLLALAGCGGASSAASGGGGSSSSSSSSSGGSSGTTTGSASLSWAAPTTNNDGSPLTDLTGYHIYYGASADLLTNQVNVNSSTTSYVVNSLVAGTWYFAVTAVNSVGLESDLSNTGSKTIN
jgi:hypothetical protein